MTVTAHLIGYPRIGPERELKWALERAGTAASRAPRSTARWLSSAERISRSNGAIGSAVDDYFLYDEVLETALMFGIVPDGRGTQLRTDPFAVLTALARGARARSVGDDEVVRHELPLRRSRAERANRRIQPAALASAHVRGGRDLGTVGPVQPGQAQPAGRGERFGP